MRLWVLGSGSKGNAVLLESGDARVLVDAGFGTRTLAQRLSAIGVQPASISACVLTHEHGDHVRGAGAAARRWGWQLHATAGTASGTSDVPDGRLTTFQAGAELDVAGFKVETIASPHDAAEPVVLVFTDSRTGARAGVIYDLGHVTESVRAACSDLDLLMIEANHDEVMLRTGPYPASVQARIASRSGHLSNRAAAELARQSVNRNLAHVVLAHLSENCNDHGVAVTTVRGALSRSAYRGQVTPAMQHAPVGPFTPRAGRCAPEAQLTLF
ncbi:MAG TPA: MBL fold metallo-hydrolase [Gemmatimonadales bacterium]